MAQNKKVLVIEDNKDVSSLLREKLEYNGFSVNIVDNGYAVLGYMKDGETPNVIILDIMLPERSGVELLDTLKNKWPEAKIFVFTAYPEAKRKIDIFDQYLSGFFSKLDGIDNLIKDIQQKL